MLQLPHGPVRALIGESFALAGCSGAEAGRIADSLVGASLAGHDSHGIMRVPQYLDGLQSGQVRADRTVRVLRAEGASCLLDGELGFGQTIGPQAVRYGIERARGQGVGLVALRNSGHLGRIGEWAAMAAGEGLVSVHFVNARGSPLVAPHGGRERRLSTAPFCVAVPRGRGDPVILDFATSRVAEGKVRVALRGGAPLPAGALVDAEGRSTDDPAALYGDNDPDQPRRSGSNLGAIRAMGDHKGSGLALICELLAGALTGGHCCGPEERPFANGMLSFYVDPEVLSGGESLAASVAEYVDWVRASAPAEAGGAVLAPGDPERQSAARRRAEGLPVPAPIWASIATAMCRSGLAPERILALGLPAG